MVWMRAGSSPRVRGTRRRSAVAMLKAGIIPACAGNTLCIRGTGSPMRDHPRVCGEHTNAQASPDTCRGSSPRVRGTPDDELFYARRDGIIPACAGNTFEIVGVVGHIRDHPRVCGEHVLTCGVTCATRGSSPRVRGTLLFKSQCGIIPACAGNTACRSCGIIPACAGNTRYAYMPRHCRRAGIIPACAGNTSYARYTSMRVMQGSSPRVRGTH